MRYTAAELRVSARAQKMALRHVRDPLKHNRGQRGSLGEDKKPSIDDDILGRVS